jgi:DNA-binding LytR/AlgR family response regulator
MPTAIIAEDEPFLRAELRQALEALWPTLTIVSEAHDGISAIQALNEFQPDIAFLDINMPGLTGLEVAKLAKDKTSIVFLTAYKQHALDAFDLGAVDYLVKPLSRHRLGVALERLKARLAGGVTEIAPIVPEETRAVPAAQSKYLRWIQATTGNLLRLIPVDEVLYFQSDAKYTRVVLEDGECLIRKPIRELIDDLDPLEFLQVNRGAIVSLRRIAAISRSDGHMEAMLKGREERLSITGSYQAAFKQL